MSRRTSALASAAVRLSRCVTQRDHVYYCLQTIPCGMVGKVWVDRTGTILMRAMKPVCVIVLAYSLSQ